MSKIKKSAFILLTTIFSTIVVATEKSQPFCGSSKPEQAKNLNNFTKELYQIVSGKAQSKRNWQLMRDLFSPEGQVTPVFNNKEGHKISKLTVDEFIELNKVVFADVDFYETEVNSNIYQYGNSATIISQYESRDAIDAAPYSTGVNSFQLVNDGNRWCVISVTWDSDKGLYPTTHFVVE